MDHKSHKSLSPQIKKIIITNFQIVSEKLYSYLIRKLNLLVIELKVMK